MRPSAFISILIIFLSVCTPLFSNAGSEVTIASNIVLAMGGARTINLNESYIDSVQITVEGNNSITQVWCNGKPKGSIFSGPRSSLKTTTILIQENTTHIELRNTSGSVVRVQLVRVLGLQAAEPMVRPSFNRFASANSLLVHRAGMMLQSLHELKPQTNYANLGAYLLPMRKAAAELYSVASANAEPNSRVRVAMIELLTRIYDAQAFLNSSLETDTAFDDAVEIITMRETLSAMLN